jgi:pimeloyl-ACP methyl ester carboxylesterase
MGTNHIFVTTSRCSKPSDHLDKLMYQMSVFCLIHGSTQNPSGWNLLVPELESQGHQVICPDLPVDKPEASATHYAEVVTAALQRSCDPPIVVAHSVSGLLLPLVAKQRPVRTHGVPGGHNSAGR